MGTEATSGPARRPGERIVPGGLDRPDPVVPGAESGDGTPGQPDSPDPFAAGLAGDDAPPE